MAFTDADRKKAAKVRKRNAKLRKLGRPKKVTKLNWKGLPGRKGPKLHRDGPDLRELLNSLAKPVAANDILSATILLTQAVRMIQEAVTLMNRSA